MNRIIIKNLIRKPMGNILGYKSFHANVQWTGIKAFLVPWQDNNLRQINSRLPYESFGGSENL